MKKESFIAKRPRSRLFMVLLLVCCICSSYAFAANNRTVTIIDNNIIVKEALNQVKKQAKVNIMYADATLNDIPLKLTLNKVPWENALSTICSKAGMKYEIVEHNYVLILPLEKGGSKRKTITGTIMDTDGVPVIGASVVIKGTTYGTIVDANGQFMLSYPASTASDDLMISYVGMQTINKKMNGKRAFDFTMKSDVTGLDEVVVIGYGTAKPKDLTGSVSRVSQAEMKNVPMMENVQGALQGRAAGVNVMIGSSSPTSPVSVVIRGVSSLSGDGQPLWVIDGVPQYSSSMSGDVSNTLYNLNLNDVECIDILKDASASAIYGSRGANGVVIVTTKSGSEGMKPTVELSARYGWQNISSNSLKTFSADEYIAYSKQANIDEAFRQGALTYFNKKYMDNDKYLQWNTSQWDKSDLANLFLSTAYYNGHDNYWDMMTQKAAMQDYNISLRGGSKACSYFTSLGYKDQEGIVKGSDSKTYSGRFNFEGKVRDILKVGVNLDASVRTSNNKDNLISKIIGMRPDYPAYTEDGEINTIDYYTKNPLIELMDINKGQSRNLNASLFLEYNILPYLKFRTTGNISYSNVKSETHTRKYYSGDINSGTESHANNNVAVWENLLTFYKTMGKHDLQAILGHSLEQNTYDRLYVAASNFPDDDVLNDIGSASSRDRMTTSKSTNSLVSAFARAQYKYNNRYLLTATFRADGSSRFGKDSRWGYFPSAAVGWIMTEENFMKGCKDIVSYLKLRASYGLTGSQNLGNYDFVTLMSSDIYNGKPAIVPSSLGNNNLQWESQSQTDIGLDYGFFNDRIRGSFGWYRKYVDNLIYNKPVPTSSSFSEVSQNIGAISNTGIEFDIRAEIIKNKDLTWEVNFNAAHNKGKVEKLNGITKTIGGGAYQSFKLEEGGEMGRFYGYRYGGRLFLNNEEVWGKKPIDQTTGKNTAYRDTREGAGDLYIVDLNGDGKITVDDREYLGSSTPKVFGGFGTTLYYKGLMVNATFTYSIGGKRYWQREQNTCNGINVYNAPNFLNDGYVMKGEDATYPFVSHYGWGSNGIFCDRWLHNASYLRLSSLNVSYKLPQSLFKSMLIQGVEFNFQATNLFTITKYPGFDPQGNFTTSNLALYGFGYDVSTYPTARTLNIGVRLTFK